MNFEFTATNAATKPINVFIQLFVYIVKLILITAQYRACGNRACIVNNSAVLYIKQISCAVFVNILSA